MVKAGGADKQQTKRAKRWTGQRCKRFLTVLEQTGQVRLAAMAVGRPDTSSAYRLRRRDADFAVEWEAAIQSATARIEGALIERALAAIEAQAAGQAEGATIEPLDFSQTMQLLKYYQAAPNERRRGGAPRQYATREETDAVLMKKLDVLEAQVRAREKREAAGRKAARAAEKEAAAKGAA